ncbi:hypothetical protein [Haemophilus parahaemolyticus]
MGSWQDSQWAGFDIKLDHRETLGQSATTVQIAIDAEEVEEFKALCEQMGLSKPKALNALRGLMA